MREMVKGQGWRLMESVEGKEIREMVVEQD